MNMIQTRDYIHLNHKVTTLLISYYVHYVVILSDNGFHTTGAAYVKDLMHLQSICLFVINTSL